MNFNLPPSAVLEFTSWPMLGWLAAAAVPWIIHRRSRQQHQTTPWAAVDLLLRAMQKRARRVRLAQWLLLAVRTAILMLVALAVAQPTLRQWARGAVGTEQTHRILVVDQSYSMGCQQQGSSRWERAQAVAREWIESSDGDALTLIGWSDQAENLTGRPTFEPAVAVAALEDLQLTQTTGDLPTAARAVLAAMDRAELEVPQVRAHHVIFCTDLGHQNWSADASQRELLETMDERAEVTIVNVAGDQRDNVAIVSLTVEPVIAMQQRDTIITTTLACFGRARPEGVGVELFIDKQKVHTQQVPLRSNGEATIRFTHRFVDQGAHTVQVQLTDDDNQSIEHDERLGHDALAEHDGLASDDVRWLIVDVRARLRVACFAGQQGAVADLARALAPDGGLTDNEGAIEPEVFSASRLGEVELSNYAAILLGSVTEWSSREAAAVTEYVRQGGGLAIFLGPASTDQRLGLLGQLLPVQVEPLQPIGEFHFDPQGYRHPITSPFRGQAQAGLLGVTISQYRRFQLRGGRPKAETVLKFNTGDPALIVDQYGLGRVAVSALPGSLAVRTASGAPWSSFALSPSFLPVVRELVVYLVGDSWLQQRNLRVGELAIFPWTRGNQSASVRLPGGVRELLPVPAAEDESQMVFRSTNDRGVYRFLADGQECARFAVNLDGRDSDLMPIDLATLPVDFSNNTVESALDPPTASADFSLARPLLAAALVLLMLEIGLAWWLGRGWR